MSRFLSFLKTRFALDVISGLFSVLGARHRAGQARNLQNPSQIHVSQPWFDPLTRPHFGRNVAACTKTRGTWTEGEELGDLEMPGVAPSSSGAPPHLRHNRLSRRDVDCARGVSPVGVPDPAVFAVAVA